jgi:hypothetical protein
MSWAANTRRREPFAAAQEKLNSLHRRLDGLTLFLWRFGRAFRGAPALLHHVRNGIFGNPVSFRTNRPSEILFSARSANRKSIHRKAARYADVRQ